MGKRWSLVLMCFLAQLLQHVPMNNGVNLHLWAVCFGGQMKNLEEAHQSCILPAKWFRRFQTASGECMSRTCRADLPPNRLAATAVIRVATRRSTEGAATENLAKRYVRCRGPGCCGTTPRA